MLSQDVSDLSKLYFIYTCKLREVFAVFKINITIEASKFMSKDQFDVRKGPNLKLQLNMHFRCPYFAEMLNPEGSSFY